MTGANARLSGCAKLPAPYWVIGSAFGKPQSQAGPRRSRRDANRCTTQAVPAPQIATKAITRNPL